MKRHPGFKDLTGKRFGLLVVIKEGAKAYGTVRWVCQCHCGNETVVRAGNLQKGNVKSCGCSKGELITKAKTRHGCSLKGQWTPEYSTWSSMVCRCRSGANHNRYSSYAGRGIRVCERWKVFDNFFADLGRRPPAKSIERQNNDGNYSCGSCPECIKNGWIRNGKWASQIEQARNTRSNRRYTFNNETLCGSEWADRIGIQHSTLHARLKAGWTVERALTTPLLRS